MKILVLCDRVDRAGGTESYLARVLPALMERGCDVRVIARTVDDETAFGPRAEQIAWSGDDDSSDADAGRAVAGVIRAWTPDVAIASNVHDAAVVASARLAPRFVVRVHDHRLFCPQGDRQYPHLPALCTRPMSATTCLSNALLRGCANGIGATSVRLVRTRIALRERLLTADRFVVSSSFMARLCARNGVSAERIAVIPPPIEGERATLPSPRPAADRVLFAGRLVRDKGLRSLIRALGRIPVGRRPALAVAGAPTRESDALPALAARLGVRMTLLGKLTMHELNAEIDASTMIAVPSLWPEPFGLMGIEAHARARPVVAYAVGGIPEWMGNAGLLVPREDEAGLARAILTILEPDRWVAFSNAGSEQAAAYSVRAHVSAFFESIRNDRQKELAFT